jgi:NAD(P)-dependent dehydrogenase (short-subunit alcohol dehydrogenase family)
MIATNIRVVLTGASIGIGAATAIAFARDGAMHGPSTWADRHPFGFRLSI